MGLTFRNAGVLPLYRVVDFYYSELPLLPAAAEPHDDVVNDSRSRAMSYRAAQHARVVLAAFAFCFAAQSGAADSTSGDDLTDLSIEQLMQVEVRNVTTAAKHEQKSSRAPASVNVITAQEIKQFGWLTLGDALRTIPGVYVSDNRNYELLGVRGLNRPGDLNSRVLVMIDGHRINDGIFAQGFIDGTFPLDLDLVDRIEIVRGPGSALYGTGAFLAVVNVIPKTGAQIDGGEISGRLATHNTYAGRATAGKKYASGLELIGSVTSYSSQGERRIDVPEFRNDASRNFGTIENADGERWRNGYLGLSYGDFKLMASQSSRKKNYGTGLYGTIFSDPSNDTTDGGELLDAQYSRNVANNTNLYVRGYYHAYHYRSGSNYDFPPVARISEAEDSKWWGTEVRLSMLLAERHRFTTGVEYVDYVKNSLFLSADLVGTQLDEDRPFRTAAIYAQDEIALSERWSLTLGLRHDRLYQNNNATSPRVGLVYAPSERTALKWLYGQAFRAPNAYELYYVLPGYVAPTNLRPETINTAEFVLEQALSNNLRATASFYEYRVKDLISGTVDQASGLLTFANVERVRTRGAELELRGRWGEFQVRGSYSWQLARDTISGNVLSNAPRHLAAVNASTPLWSERWRMGFETQYVSPRLGDRGDGSRIGVSGYYVSNLTLFHATHVRGLELSSGIYNLFDRSYREPRSSDDDPLLNGVPQARRTYWLKATYRF